MTKFSKFRKSSKKYWNMSGDLNQPFWNNLNPTKPPKYNTKQRKKPIDDPQNPPRPQIRHFPYFLWNSGFLGSLLFTHNSNESKRMSACRQTNVGLSAFLSLHGTTGSLSSASLSLSATKIGYGTTPNGCRGGSRFVKGDSNN